MITDNIDPEHITEAMLSNFFELNLGQALINLGQQIRDLESRTEPEMKRLLSQAASNSPSLTDILKLLAIKAGINCHETLSPITAFVGRVFQLRAFVQD